MLKNVIKIMTGTIGAQAIAFLFMPIVTRLYSAENFGVLASFGALTGPLTPLAALCLPFAIVMCKTKREVLFVARTSFTISVLICLIFTLVTVISGAFIADLIGLPSKYYLYLVPLVLVSSSALLILQNFAVREGAFGQYSASLFFQAAIINILKTLGGLIRPSGALLIYLNSFEYFVKSATLFYLLSFRSKNNLWSFFTIATSTEVRIVLRRHLDFILFRAPQTILNAIGFSLPILMLSSNYGVFYSGQFILTSTALFVPSAILGKAVLDVFYPKISKIIQIGDSCFQLLLKSTFYLSLISVICYSPMLFFGPIIFTFVFGSEWEVAGRFSSIMSLWLIGVLASRAVISAIPPLRIQKEFVIFEALSLFIKVAVLTLSIVYNANVHTFVFLFSASSLFSYIVLIVYVIIKSSKTGSVRRQVS